MTIKTFIVRLTSVIFTIYGLAFIFIPKEISQFVTGSVPGTTSGVIDIRATYGGMSVAIGVLLLILSSDSDVIDKGLIGVLLLMVGMAGSRIYGIFVDGSPNLYMYIYLILELSVAMVACWALVKKSKNNEL